MANEIIKVNGKDYKAKDLNFNFLCDLGENGIEINDIGTKVLSALRVYIAFCMNTDVETAGNEISLHCINGGTLDELAKVFNQKAEESDFFRSMERKSASTQKGNSKNSSKEKEAEVSE